MLSAQANSLQELMSVATQFIPTCVDVCVVEGGLINQSFKITDTAGTSFLLQKINTHVFTNQLLLAENYEVIYKHCKQQGYFLPVVQNTIHGNALLHQGSDVWRCFEFVENSYTSEIANTPRVIKSIAHNFAKYTHTLQGLSAETIKPTIPHFHDLLFRYEQYKTAEKLTIIKGDVTVAEGLEQYSYLVKVYGDMARDTINFPVRLYHHDAKGTNILLSKINGQPICVIDLDTTMPGLFISDLGDMVRSLAFQYQTSAEYASASFSEELYNALLEAYTTAAPLTPKEKEHIHYAGAMIVYMQALRFYTDYLQGSTYYKISYANENLQRTKAHLEALVLLQKFMAGT
jgi:thiamine kinase-like enzyme